LIISLYRSWGGPYLSIPPTLGQKPDDSGQQKEGAYGGRYGLDGMDSIDTLYANTRNNPIEDLESHLPLRIERYELRDDVCLAGQ